MYGPGDSIDISQLQAFALDFNGEQPQDHDPQPGSATPSRGQNGELTALNETQSTGNSASPITRLRKTARSEPWPGSIPPSRLVGTKKQRPQQTASQPELPSTVPDSWPARMPKSDTQSEGDTQPLSQSLYAQYNVRNIHPQAPEPSLESQEETAPHTLQPGEPGHVDLLANFEPSSTNGDRDYPVEDADEDDIDPLSQPQDVRADIFPESRRFQQPKTPASQGRKRKRGAESSSQGQITPRLPVNPFAGQIGNTNGLMDASQLFKATQAVTSPLAKAVASDGLTERPSPDMQIYHRPSTAGSLSSPVRLPRSNMVRAVTEPQPTEFSISKSQEPRIKAFEDRRAGQATASDDFSDDDFNENPSLERRLRMKRYRQEARDQFAQVSARPEKRVRKSSRSREAQANDLPVNNSAQKPGARANKPVLISDDAPVEEVQGSVSEDETEREDELDIQDDVDDIDELAEDNKENIEVPGTITRRSFGRSQIVSSQPTPSHKTNRESKGRSLTRKEVQVLGSSQASNFRDTPVVVDTGTQPEAIADSQPSQNQAYLRTHNPESGRGAISEPRSSLDSQVMVPQSQPSEGPKALHPPSTLEGHQFSSSVLAGSISQNQVTNDQNPPATVNTTESTVDPLQATASTTGARENRPELQSSDGLLIETSSLEKSLRPGTIPESTSGEDNVRNQDVAPESSTMPSPRATPKSSSNLALNNSVAGSSRISTLFETAPERLPEATSKLSPLHKVLRSQSTQSSPEKSRRLRSMSEIAAEPSPPDAIGEVNLDIDILTKDDRDFHQVVHGSSPVASIRKRRRVASGLAIENRDPLPASPLPPPSSAISKITPVKSSLANPTPAQSSSPSHEMSPMAAKSKRLADDRVSSDQKSRDIAPNEQNIAAERASKTNKHHTTGVSDATKERNARPRNHELSAAENDSNIMPANPQVVAPNRVFAHFNGNNAAYYPATCLEIIDGDEPRYSVRFDDGTVDTISAYGIKRLELRVGDVIKIDRPGDRKQNYVVEGMQDPHRPATPPDPQTPSRRGRQHSTNDAAFPETDVHGFATVIVSPKQRASMDGTQAETSRVTAPLTQVYFTQTLWTSYRNRQYTHSFNRMKSTTGLQTPFERPSTPATPSSRLRRIRSSGVIRPRSASVAPQVNEAMFKNMAFAVTSLDPAEESQRVKEQILANGGRILEPGFDELFSVPILNRTTTPEHHTEAAFELTGEARQLGFTCVIASRHCRSVKYIQALALGIPCLATRWVSDCIAKQRVLPWAPYLLASGESRYLDGAMHSRNIQPFADDTATLASIVDQRPRLLDDASVLLIMEKSQEKTMEQHPLLTHALGARKVVKAVNVDAAVKAVADAQAVGNPWDWVFSYDKAKEVEKRLLGGSNAGKKRKRARDSDAVETPVKRMKTKVVDNEFVVQSLILGMLIDE
ncbi:radiation sensitive protein rad9 [Lecanora helva]